VTRDDSPRGGLMDGWVRAVLLAAAVIGAFIEVSTPHRRYGPLVDVFALAAVGVVGASAVLGSEAAAALARQRDRLG
jgi:hypothetical protein